MLQWHYRHIAGKSILQNLGNRSHHISAIRNINATKQMKPCVNSLGNAAINICNDYDNDIFNSLTNNNRVDNLNKKCWYHMCMFSKYLQKCLHEVVNFIVENACLWNLGINASINTFPKLCQWKYLSINYLNFRSCYQRYLGEICFWKWWYQYE